ncbi:hypothetical protein H696_03987 [Fonticula alba]|uniref:RRM domain-containing protein n=1 Tax=Fonticula alba TaxID=691883 RepID=A0A058Z5P0_FONAL|nr:hypothetical protein H696_03987 [Fonticula alba]KCV69565.1 hypothetical protein H696_03987 [Fonticula alba]|eukprot:XP_009496130.1 hypothetical protein H696_03987 [Fonticula alba]
MSSLQSRQARQNNRILFVKYLPFDVSSKTLYDLFGKFGAIQQIRLGNSPTTRGNAFVVYEIPDDANRAMAKLNGYQLSHRSITVLPFVPSRVYKKADLDARRARLDAVAESHGVQTDDLEA